MRQPSIELYLSNDNKNKKQTRIGSLGAQILDSKKFSENILKTIINTGFIYDSNLFVDARNPVHISYVKLL